MTATALGLEATLNVEVSGDSFTFSAPEAGAEIDLGTSIAVTVVLERDGGPIAGETITFTTTRGTLSAASDTTDADGVASVNIESTNSGPAVVTATNAIGTSTQLNIEFVATTPATLELHSQGNGVEGVNVSVSVLSQRYWDGTRAYVDPPGAWLTRRGHGRRLRHTAAAGRPLTHGRLTAHHPQGRLIAGPF